MCLTLDILPRGSSCSVATALSGMTSASTPMARNLLSHSHVKFSQPYGYSYPDSTSHSLPHSFTASLTTWQLSASGLHPASPGAPPRPRLPPPPIPQRSLHSYRVFHVAVEMVPGSGGRGCGAASSNRRVKSHHT